MNGEPASRDGRAGALLTALAIGASAVGVIGWHVTSNRGETRVDASGFDLADAPKSQAGPGAAPSGAAPAARSQPASSLGMLRADAGTRVAGDGTAPKPAGPSGSPAPSNPREEARLSFAEAARKHEGAVRRFSERMSAKHPVLRQYGRDWMSHPDLKKLNDDYMRDRDPIKFMLGLSRSPNFGKLVKKYAAAPELREFVVQGMREAPAELTSAAVAAINTDGVVKGLVQSVAQGMGLPPSITAVLGSKDPEKVDQQQVLSEMMKDPGLRKAMEQAPPAR